MNIKFITIGLVIIGALYFGTEKYWQHEFEEQQRNELKSLTFDEKMQEEKKTDGHILFWGEGRGV